MKKKSDLTDALLEAHNFLRRYMTIWYGKNFDGLDPQQGQGLILSELRRGQIFSQKEIGLALDIRPQSLGELLQKLEANGYIQRYRSTTDKRALLVELTEKGENFQQQKPDYHELFIGLNAQEKKLLKTFLEKISAQLNELIERETDDEFF